MYFIPHYSKWGSFPFKDCPGALIQKQKLSAKFDKIVYLVLYKVENVKNISKPP